MPANKLFMSERRYPATASSSTTTWSNGESSAVLDNAFSLQYALQLRLPNPHDLQTDCIEVDRQKLTQMLAKSLIDQDMNIAEYFFENVTKTTTTLINWPRTLEAGVKQNCHVRIFGEIQNIQMAKKQILTYLAPPCRDVKLKMCSNSTDHEFIIGQDGENLKYISEETKTMVYFSDMNPINMHNQIAITGAAVNVERARTLVQLSRPFSISFYLPMQTIENPTYLKTLEETYNLQIELTSQRHTSTTWVVVKGYEKEAAQIMDSVKCLLIYVYECENNSSDSTFALHPIQMDLEISPEYHKFMKGINDVELVRIMQQTETTIIFPNLTDVNDQKPWQNYRIKVIGSIDGAYKARQQLLANLPITLNFDLRGNEIDKIYAAGIKYHTSLHISIEQKYRENGALPICIEGKEKDVETIYKAYTEIMELTST